MPRVVCRGEFRECVVRSNDQIRLAGFEAYTLSTPLRGYVLLRGLLDRCVQVGVLLDTGRVWLWLFVYPLVGMGCFSVFLV